MTNKLIPNSTQIPNVLIDFVIPQIGGAEAKCLLYICRRTYGFHKEIDRISISQFEKGIKNKDGEILDHGCGLSRPSIIDALKSLVGSGLIDRVKTGKGNYYKINLDIAFKEGVVKKVNQLKKLTRSGKESKPKQVKLFNPQKKGNKVKQRNMSPEPTEWLLKEEIEKLKEDKRRHIEIIGIWFEETKFTPENGKQMQSELKRNLRPAKELVGYDNERIIKTVKAMRGIDYLKKFTLETVSKYINEDLKKVSGQSFVRKLPTYEEIKKEKGIK